MVWLMRMHRRLGAALGDKRRDADRQHQQRRQRPGLGKHRHAQPHRQRRTDDKADFIEHRLQRIRGLQLRLAAIDLGPARPHHRRHARHATGQRGEDKQRPGRRLQTRAQQQHQQRPAADQRRYRQNPSLPETVNQTRHLRRAKRRGQGKRRRHRTGQRIPALQLREHGDHADTGHGNRHARDHPGQHKIPCAGGVEQFAVGVCHGLQPHQGPPSCHRVGWRGSEELLVECEGLADQKIAACRSSYWRSHVHVGAAARCDLLIFELNSHRSPPVSFISPHSRRDLACTSPSPDKQP